MTGIFGIFIDMFWGNSQRHHTTIHCYSKYFYYEAQLGPLSTSLDH